MVPLSALPIGHTRSIQDTQLVEINPMDGDGTLLSKLCALPQIEGSRKPKAKTEETAEAVKEEDAAKKEEDGLEEPENLANKEDESDVADVEVVSSTIVGFVHM